MWSNPKEAVLTFANLLQSIKAFCGRLPDTSIRICGFWATLKLERVIMVIRSQPSAVITSIQAKLVDICRKMAGTHSERQIGPVNILSRLSIWDSIYGHFNIWPVLLMATTNNFKQDMKHRKNCVCCLVSLLNVRSQRLSWIKVQKNC